MFQKYLSEALGTAFLLIGVVGSGIMADSLTGDTALALLANAVATGCILFVLITTLGPISGAHFNPAVTLMFLWRGDMSARTALGYIIVQIIGGILGVWAAHGMFDLSILQAASTARSGPPQWFSEIIATFGLLFVILVGLKSRAEAVPALVAFYITGAYWFTSSTSFANPAVTIARGFSDTFAGINPAHIPGFILAQMVGLIIAAVVLPVLLRDPN